MEKAVQILQSAQNAGQRRVITKIEADPKEKPKLRVAAYCRVSTSREDQLTSIEAQRTHYDSLIRSNDEWELVDIYYEEGVTGTRKEVRPELQRMLDDCRRGRIDLILTKSISRFARNTSDCLEMVRALTGLGVNIYFEKENIRTGSMESEFMLTILASFAEEESLSISRNEKWAIRKRFENGTYRFSKAPYGYRLQDDGFVVDDEQAAVVRRIFDSVLEGKGTTVIARELNEKGIPTCTTKRDGTPGEWTPSRIQSMITNITYTGDVIFQKTFKDEKKKRLINYGERPQYYVEDHHPAIIGKEVFEQVQKSNRQRGREKNNNPPADRSLRRSAHHNRTCLSGRVICGNCGSVMKRQTQTVKAGRRYHWVCSRHLRDITACGHKRVMEEDIQNTFMTMLNKLYFAKPVVIDSYIEELRLAERPNRPETEAALAFRKFVDKWGDEGSLLPEGARREFPAEAFDEHVAKLVICSRTRFVFHLRCGLVFEESLISGEAD